MFNNMSRDCTICPYRGRSLYIVGPHRFKNQLLYNFLATHTAAKLHTATNLQQVPSELEAPPLKQKLILIDCATLGRESIVRFLETEAWNKLSVHLLMLFEIDRQLHMEEDLLFSGVQGIVFEDDPLDQILDGICAVNRGEIWASRRALSRCLCKLAHGQQRERKIGHCLTEREKQLLSLLAQCKTNEEIATELFISPHTVKTHLYNIFKKINVPNRMQAAIWAAKNL